MSKVMLGAGALLTITGLSLGISQNVDFLIEVLSNIKNNPVEILGIGLFLLFFGALGEALSSESDM